MIIQGIGVWLPSKKRLNSEWPPSFSAGARSSGPPAADASNKVNLTKTRGDDGGTGGGIVSQDRTFNDMQTPIETEIAEVARPFLERESKDPFLGVKERRVADKNETVAVTAAIASRNALEDAKLHAKDVDVIIGNAPVPDYLPMQVAASVARELGCRSGGDDENNDTNAGSSAGSGGVLAFDIDAGCASGLIGMEIAQGMLINDPDKVILVVVTNLLTRIQPMEHPSSPGLGDGAVAFVLTSGGRSRRENGDGLLGLKVNSIVAHTHPEFSNAVIYVRDKNLRCAPQKWFEVSDKPLYVGSHESQRVKYLMQNTIALLIKTVKEAIRKADGAREDLVDIDYLVSVQPRGFIPIVASKILNMQTISTYETLGHLGGAGFMMNLYELKRRGSLQRPGTKVACYCQGSGFIRGAAVLEVVRACNDDNVQGGGNVPLRSSL